MGWQQAETSLSVSQQAEEAHVKVGGRQLRVLLVGAVCPEGVQVGYWAAGNRLAHVDLHEQVGVAEERCLRSCAVRLVLIRQVHRLEKKRMRGENKEGLRCCTCCSIKVAASMQERRRQRGQLEHKRGTSKGANRAGGSYPASVAAEVADDVPAVGHVRHHAGGWPGVVASVGHAAAVSADDVADLAADLGTIVITDLCAAAGQHNEQVSPARAGAGERGELSYKSCTT